MLESHCLASDFFLDSLACRAPATPETLDHGKGISLACVVSGQILATQAPEDMPLSVESIGKTFIPGPSCVLVPICFKPAARTPF